MELDGMFMRLRGGSRPHLSLITAFLFCALQFATPSLAQEVDNPCERIGMNAATFVAVVGATESHRIRVALDLPFVTLSVNPVVVEQGFRGVATGQTVYLYLAFVDS